MIAVLPLAGALLLAQADAGYVRTRTDDGLHCLRWPVSAPTRSTLTFVQSTAGDPALNPPDVFGAIAQAAQTWEAQMQVCGSLDLVEGARSVSRSIGNNRQGSNENLVLVRTRDCATVVMPGDPCHSSGDCGNAYDCWDHGAAVIALTLMTFTADDGVLLGADIEINGVSQPLTLVDSPPCPPGITQACAATDVQNAVTHEFGHFLGLAHSPDPSSTMFATEQRGETSKRTLDPGSRQFVCDVYPAGLASRDCLTTDAGTDPGGGSGGNSTGGGTPGPGLASHASGCDSGGTTLPSTLGLLAALLAALASRVPR
jgi:Matrixin